ncbi:DNA -binding domain-containing protein [Mesorhizobium sp. ORM8.1]
MRSCLNALHATGQLPDRLFPLEARASRLRFVLQALDGSLGGASHRKIARALLGRQRVQADWTDPRNHVADRIRGAVRRGHILMDRGYRDFLA